jgi:hypothetical protein
MVMSATPLPRKPGHHEDLKVFGSSDATTRINVWPRCDERRHIIDIHPTASENVDD